MLLTVLQETGEPPQQRLSSQSVSSAKAEELQIKELTQCGPSSPKRFLLFYYQERSPNGSSPKRLTSFPRQTSSRPSQVPCKTRPQVCPQAAELIFVCIPLQMRFSGPKHVICRAATHRGTDVWQRGQVGLKSSLCSTNKALPWLGAVPTHKGPM